MKRILLALSAALALGFGIAQTATVDMSDQTIGEILNTTNEVSILDFMVDIAGLEETLNSEGPFTVFAPMDRAWVGINSETITDLMNQPDLLQQILLYHVVSGRVDSDRLFTLLLSDAGQQIADDTTAGMEVEEPVEAVATEEGDAAEAPLDDQAIGDEATSNLEVEDPVRALIETGVTNPVTFETVEGSTIEVTAARITDTLSDGGRMIGEGEALLGVSEPVAALETGGVDLLVGNARIVSVDIIASNGVIHLIAGVLVPDTVELPN